MSGHEPRDWETMEAIDPQAGEGLERTMARYARVRLEPSPAQIRRARTAAMEAAWRSRIEADPTPRRRHLPFSSWSLRRVSLAASAAVFAGLLLGSSVFAASRAGGPLYEARIALEDATLPADPAARLQAQIANAQVRLAEAYDAEARNDPGALAAALHAYVEDATSLAQATGPDAPQVLAAMQQHRTVLLSLIGQANANALPGLDQALFSSDKAIQRLSSSQAPGVGNGGGGNGSQDGGNGNGGGNGNSDPGGNGVGSGHPVATPAPPAQPVPTPKPDHTAKPVPTPKPDHTAKPVPAMSNAVNPSAPFSASPSASPSVP